MSWKWKGVWTAHPHPHVPFPSSVAEGVQEDRPQYILHMSAHRRDGGKAQSGGVKCVIAPASDPGTAEPDDDDF